MDGMDGWDEWDGMDEWIVCVCLFDSVRVEIFSDDAYQVFILYMCIF